VRDRDGVSTAAVDGVNMVFMQRVADRSFAEAARERLVDEAFGHYLDWRDECAAVADAYRNWSNAVASESALSFAAYVAALDREERAAGQYELVLGKAHRVLADGLRLMKGAGR
jgi:hypothetical protein